MLFRPVVPALLGLALAAPALAQPHHRVLTSELSPAGTAACTFPDGTTPTGRPEVHCYDPATFLHAYGIDRLHAMGLTGKGQTIILVDSFGSPTMQADLDHFSDTFGLPRTTIQFVYPNGAYLNPLANADQLGWAEETTLDLEWAHAVAPEATLVNVISNNSETTGLTGLPDLMEGIRLAAQAYPGAIVSMSFGTGEPTFTGAEVETYLLGRFHDVLKGAAAADVTLLASSGDSGSTNINTDQSAYVVTPNVGYPASDPLVTAVGGTALQAGWRWTPEGTADDFWTCKLGKITPCPTDFLKATGSDQVLETVWKEDWAIAAGGGGVSAVFARPWYQQDVNERTQKVMNGHRGVPDVALNAAINGGVEVYTSFIAPALQVTKPTWQSFGGTSCSSPEAAGLVALAGQRASERLGRQVGIGFLNPILYSLEADDFHDILGRTLGDEGQVDISSNALYFNAAVLAKLGPASIPPVAVAGFETGRRYDLATGRGSPRAVNFVLDVAEARVARGLIAPDDSSQHQ